MRTLLELYNILLEEYQSSIYLGICAQITELKDKCVITCPEYLALRHHFNYFPKPSSYYKNQPYYFSSTNRKGRIDFINKILSSLKET